MSKIGIHAVPAFRPNPTGVEAYAREIITRLCVLASRRHVEAGYGPAKAGERDTSCILYTNQEPQNPIPGADVKVLTGPSVLWTQFRLSYEMFLNPPDALFVPGNALPQILPKRSVVTIHGLEFVQHPGNYAWRNRTYLALLTKDAVRRADAIIVPSYATASALFKYFGVTESKVHVIHHGAPTPAPAATNDQRPTTHDKSYFLYVGRVEAHKNVRGIVEAFSRFRDQGGDADLVLAGNPGFGYNRIKGAIDASSAREHIVEVGYVSETEKWELLQGAVALVFPSFSEGFGLPILEAQAAGCPVVTSDVTAMPEVAGEGGALLVDPSDTEALTDAMRQIANDAGLQHRLAASGKKNLKRFSWDRAAEQTLDVLLGG